MPAGHATVHHADIDAHDVHRPPAEPVDHQRRGRGIHCELCCHADTAGIGDTQFLRSMIPHHSGAILMCQEASLDPQLIALCKQIVTSQQEEIATMLAISRVSRPGQPAVRGPWMPTRESFSPDAGLTAASPSEPRA